MFFQRGATRHLNPGFLLPGLAAFSSRATATDTGKLDGAAFTAHSSGEGYNAQGARTLSSPPKVMPVQPPRGPDVRGALGVLWCRLMHDDVTWPIRGNYQCRICGFIYRVPWANQKNTHQ